MLPYTEAKSRDHHTPCGSRLSRVTLVRSTTAAAAAATMTTKTTTTTKTVRSGYTFQFRFLHLPIIGRAPGGCSLPHRCGAANVIGVPCTGLVPEHAGQAIPSACGATDWSTVWKGKVSYTTTTVYHWLIIQQRFSHLSVQVKHYPEGASFLSCAPNSV